MYIGQYLYTIKSTEGSTNLPTPIAQLFNFYCEILRWINPSTHPLNHRTGNTDTRINLVHTTYIRQTTVKSFVVYDTDKHLISTPSTY